MYIYVSGTMCISVLIKGGDLILGNPLSFITFIYKHMGTCADVRGQARGHILHAAMHLRL